MAPTLLALLAIAALAVGAAVLGKRFGLSGASGPVSLVGRLPLDQRRCVYLVRVGETVLVVGASEAGLVKLSEVPRASLEEGVRPS